MAEQTEKRAPVRLTWSESNRAVIIVPEDEDRYAMRVEEVIEACHAYGAEQRAAVRSQFKKLTTVLGAWIEERREKIDTALITTRHDRLLFLVIMSRKECDEELEDALTDLDLRVADDDDLSLIELGVLALPRCEQQDWECFVNPDVCFVYQGHAEH